MLKDDFAALNERDNEPRVTKFANPRNLAGARCVSSTRAWWRRVLTFIAYDLIRDHAGDVPTNMFAYEAVTAVGIRRNMQASVFDSVNGVMQFVDSWAEKRRELPFNTDGLVIKVNDRGLFAELGIVGKTPRGAVAYKYAAESKRRRLSKTSSRYRSDELVRPHRSQCLIRCRSLVRPCSMRVCTMPMRLLASMCAAATRS